MKSLRACWRLLRLLGHIVKGLAIVALRFPALSPDQQHARVQVWSLQLLAHLGISLRILGQPPLTGPVMLVANHISWLDIPVMHAARHCRFVSKSDVQGWPLIGTLATAAGTLYIERSSRRDALRILAVSTTGVLLAWPLLLLLPDAAPLADLNDPLHMRHFRRPPHRRRQPPALAPHIIAPINMRVDLKDRQRPPRLQSLQQRDRHGIIPAQQHRHRPTFAGEGEETPQARRKIASPGWAARS